MLGLSCIHKRGPEKAGSISHCTGCRPRNKQCAYLKGNRALLRNDEVAFCFQCPDYPCTRLLKLDRRYRTMHGVSPVGNLEEIRSTGVERFNHNQQERHGCRTCGGKISIHNKECFHCERVVRWNS